MAAASASSPNQQEDTLSIADHWAQLEKEIPRSNAQLANLVFASAGTDVANRYSNVLPIKQTRVLLGNHLHNEGYINANWVKVPGPPSSAPPAPAYPVNYIVTQAPLPPTVAAFWTMVHEQRVPIIVMLTRLTETDVDTGAVKNKASCYWPTSSFSIKERASPLLTVELQREVVVNPSLVSRHFQLRSRDAATAGLLETHTVHQLQFIGWPDFGVPKEDVFVDMFHAYRESLSNAQAGAAASPTTTTTTSSTAPASASAQDVQEKPVPSSPPPSAVASASVASTSAATNSLASSALAHPSPVNIIVHCSAGIGRTGVFVAIDMALRACSSSGAEVVEPRDLTSIVRFLRTCRLGMVQTKEQFQFAFNFLQSCCRAELWMTSPPSS